MVICFFFFNDTATTEIYTLSLHDALPISRPGTPAASMEDQLPREVMDERLQRLQALLNAQQLAFNRATRSEEHTSELQSRQYLVCRLLLEQKNWMRLIAHHVTGRRHVPGE